MAMNVLKIPRNMVRYLKTIVDNVSETGDFDPLTDDTTREYSFVSFIPIRQLELDWITRVYQIHYGYHQHKSEGTDDGRDKSITFMPTTAPLLMSRLVMMTEFLDYYNERMIRDKLVTEIVERLQTYQPVLTKKKLHPVETIVEVMFEEEVNRRKNITMEMHDLTQNLDLVDKILRHAWPTLGPLICSSQTRSMFITNNGLYTCQYDKRDADIRPLDKPGEFHRIELEGVLSIACGSRHNMILTRDGLFGFGDSEYGQLGLSRTTLVNDNPMPIPIDDVRHVSCGLSHTMILTRKYLFACGSSKKGQLGVPSFTSGMKEPKATYPMHVPIENVLSVTCGAEYTMVLTNDGLFGCGDNSNGQLGLGDRKDRKELTRVPIENVLSVACGLNHTFIMTSDGLFVCGDNSYGQLGLGDTETRMSPTQSTIVNVLSFAIGKNHSIILIEGDFLYVCGDNQYGQLGLGHTHANDATPTLLQLKGVLSIACGGNQSFVVTQDNVFAFGSNEYGQLGLMDNVNQPIPRPISLRFGHEYDVRVMSPVTERHDKRSRFDASLCTRCNERASFTEPFQKRYLFCGDACYTRYFTALRYTQ